MSNALAISGVTAVLQYYLGGVYSGLSALFGGTVTISSQAPDILQNTFSSGGTTQNQVNLFLHQVTHNPSWRNVDLPSLAADGKTQIMNPPLALDLHYLLTAYGSFDWQGEGAPWGWVVLFHPHPARFRQKCGARVEQRDLHASAAACNGTCDIRVGRPDRDDQDHSCNAGEGRDGVAVDGAEGGLPADISIPGLRRVDVPDGERRLRIASDEA